jgi:transposase-like protein
MPREHSAGKPTTRRYSPEEKQAAVRVAAHGPPTTATALTAGATLPQDARDRAMAD